MLRPAVHLFFYLSEGSGRLQHLQQVEATQEGQAPSGSPSNLKSVLHDKILSIVHVPYQNYFDQKLRLELEPVP